MTTEHAVCPFVHVVHLLVVAFPAGEGSAATWEAEPAVAFLEVAACTLLGQRGADSNAQLPLVASCILQLLPRRLPVALLAGDLAPMCDAGAENVCSLDGKVELGVAFCAAGALAVAGAHVANPNLLGALTTCRHNITVQELHYMAICAQHMRDRRTSAMADAGGHGDEIRCLQVAQEASAVLASVPWHSAFLHLLHTSCKRKVANNSVENPSRLKPRSLTSTPSRLTSATLCSDGGSPRDCGADEADAADRSGGLKAL
eukprot:CAMPEP_0115601454 /NCGR_PEP_ID=MMETSP0272-20121206/15410_1 /TAXON_ID=71861 /ORGANISM="Scrippsiella trochoidea, Strain CCMP3099" /LENGTH=258 /DNA_ID=CAMNT_0003036925 /DNA_START=376 /DNA_END=1153 /DNA_ORIENTATION=+